MRISAILIAISTNALLLTLGGCASTTEDMIGTPDHTMNEVYSAAMGGGSEGKLLDERSVLRRSLTESDADLSRFVRTEDDALRNDFPMLSNPEMRMFIAPHLSTRDGIPVPGYVTRFRMWERDHYALPGETTVSYTTN